jgi:hypothetical protein
LIDAPRRVVLHPLLFAAFPVLYLWAHNVREGVTFADVLWPLVLCVLGTGTLFAVGWQALGRDAARAGLALSILVVLFFSYGYVFRALEGVRIGGFRDEPETGFLIARNTYLLPVWAGLGTLAVFLSIRTRRRLAGWTQILNYTAIGLVVINVATVAWAEARGATRSGRLPPAPIPQRTLPPGTSRPDIYYIVLEEYAGERALRRFFGYDNSPFLDFLQRKGFYVAAASTANYPRTSVSLASSLNMGYLTRDPERVAGEAGSRPLLKNHAVGSYLKSIGYRYVHLGSWWSPTTANPNADVNIKFSGVSEFSTVLYQTTAIYPITQRLGVLAEKLDPRLKEYHREKFQFAQLVETRTIPSPKFVFAHIMAPHSPYVFDANGGFLPSEAVRRGRIKNVYVDQLAFVNKQVMALVERLLSGPPGSHPVILIQSDEGPYPGNPSRWSSRPSLTTLLRKFEILNAFYFPGRTYSGLHPEITPVNEFRAVFREYFDPSLPLLPDRNFVFKDVKHLYQFTEVTGQVRQSMGA